MTKEEKIIELGKRELARREFWYFCLYMDKEFFTERQDILKTIAYDMQRLIRPIPPQSELDILNVSLPPRTGKSYLTTLFSAWAFGHNPTKSIMRNSVTERLYNKFSKDLIQIMSGNSHRNRYSNIFNIEFNTVAVGGWELKNSTQGISYFGGGVGGTIIGFGADLLSILDDSVKNEEEAMSETAMDKKWGWYTSTMDSREEGNVKKLFIGTRWTKGDIVGRIEDLGIFDSLSAKNIVVPALRDGVSFCEAIHTTETLMQKKLLLSDIIWEAEYQQMPITAKGLVFPINELNTFSSVLMGDVKADFLLADLADEGNDFLSAGLIKEVDGKYYLLDVIFSKDREEVTQPQVASIIDRLLPSTCYIESNFGGKGYKRELSRLTKSRPHIKLFRTTRNKHTKIIMESGFIREHFYFRSDYEEGSDYDKFMRNLVSYNKTGKVKHDDAADMISMMSEKVRDIKTLKVGSKKLSLGI